LWDLQETSVKEVIEQLPEPKPAYNTVSTIIRILETKEFVGHKPQGRGYVYYLIIDKAPTFPGCESGDKDCFSKMVQNHFSENFDAKMVNGLGLSAGNKRVFIGFKIDKEGNVIDVQARAPHIDIKEEVLSVMSSLPKMIPGEQDGEAIAVKYSILFTIIVQ